jgi:ABC-type multidrug transport system fused ATPase/permease subunit
LNFSIRKKWRESIVFEAAHLLDRRDRQKVVWVIALQIAFGFFDLLGVMLIGVIGALAITGVSSGKPGDRVSTLLEFVGLQDSPLQVQVASIGLVAAVLLISKTLFSIYFSRRVLFFLSRRGAAVSARMVAKLLRQSLITVQSRSLQTSLYAVTHGVTLMTVGVLGVSVSMVSDISLLIVLLTGLFLVDGAMALGTLIAFSLIAYSLWRLMHVRVKNLGHKTADISVESSETVFEVLTAYREATVRNRKGFYARLIGRQRLELANLQAEMSFMPNISKYVIEIAVVISAVAIAGFQFMINDASRAVAILSIFLAATTRIAPAVLRVQQGAVSMRGTIAAAQPTLELLRELGWEQDEVETWKEPNFIYDGFIPRVELERVTFSYPGRDTDVVDEVSLLIPEGSFTGFVGSSGAGKTTLIDLMLGVLEPKIGHVLISGQSPREAIKQFPGAISYIPQDVVVVNGSIRKNVTLGFEEGSIPDHYVWDALKIAHLDEFVNTLPEKLDSSVGDRGTKLSGGQRQRLGIARAMVTKPKLLVLDEATSAMDGELELNIGEAIQEMRGEVTIVMIAHRLSTIRNCDVVFHLSEGKVTGKGTFEELKALVPEFSRQATLMGL